VTKFICSIQSQPVSWRKL